LTGGTIAIGLYCGRREAGDLESKEKAYSMARRFYEYFERDNEGVRCWDLTRCDFSTPEGLDRYHETGIHQQCAERLRRAAEASVEMLE
jgi:hypothetical protein